MQTAVLVGVNLSDPNFERSMDELAGLALACDIEPADVITQNLESQNSAFYIGPGKVQELRLHMQSLSAGLAIFNDELSPSQLRNLEEELDCAIMDRTALILEIFSRRAKTREARLQVQTAHLSYMLPRLVGLRKSLEQQTGGVGTTNRGAGEKMLELNRREIQNRITRQRKELEEIGAQRETQRRQRKKTGIPVVSLVGYTNAGKSTVMNAMLDLTADANAGADEKKVFEKDMLFATLETSVRRINLPDNKAFLLTDTVGFIDKLPHHLVKAFRSTLEEACEADLIVHVVDCSDPNYQLEMQVTDETLREVGVTGIPVICALNKADRLDIRPQAERPDSVYLSAKNGDGLDALLALIRRRLFEDYVRCEMLIPYKNGEVVSFLNKNAHILSTEYVGEGTRLSVELRERDFARYREFVVE